MSDIRIFKRLEKKYLLTKEQYTELMSRIGSELIPDEYHECMVQNIYYDTSEYRLVRASIDKPVYKEKLRLRCYNNVTPEDSGYLEIKKKYEGVVYKRRERMNLKDAMDFVENPPEKPDTQIGQELAWFVKFYGELKPAMYLNYERLAYLLAYDRTVRITFDSDIRWRTDNVTFFDGPRGELLMSGGEVLMEIKTVGALPISFVRILEELKIFPVSFSKYGAAYKILNYYNFISGGTYGQNINFGDRDNGNDLWELCVLPVCGIGSGVGISAGSHV